MKTKITILSLLFAFILQAQVTYVPMPEGYGYYRQQEWIKGDSRIFYAAGSFVYGITSKRNEGNTDYDGYIFRYDATNSTISFYSQTVPLQIYGAFFPRNIVNYNNRIYFNHANNLYRINLSNGIINEILSGSSGTFTINNNKIYSTSGGALTIFNIDTNTITIPTYTIPNTQISGKYYPELAGTNGSNVYFYGKESDDNGGYRRHKLFKVDSSDNVSIIHDFKYEGFIDVFYFTEHKRQIPIINNKMILFSSGSSTANSYLETFDIISNTFNPQGYNVGDSGQNIFEANGQIYFQDSNLTVHKTNGITTQQAGLPTFYNVGYGSYQNSAVTLYDGNYYGSHNGVFRSDLTFDNTYKISSTYNIKYSTVANNKLMFTSGEDLVSYDGKSFTAFKMGVETDSFNSGILQAGNALFVTGTGAAGIGLYKIDLSTLSVSHNTLLSKATLFPNPTQSQINFTQEINNLEVFDIAGKKVKAFNNPSSIFDVSTLQKGVYIVKGKTRDGKSVNEKLVKE